MKLLRERPDLAVLVKSVWIAIAVQFPDYTTGSHFPESTENGLAEACREYYLRIGHEDTLVPEGPDGTRIPELTTVALKNRLRMLPKAHHIRMVPPPITWTPPYILKQEYRHPTEYDFPFDKFVGSSVWTFLILQTRLYLLPPTCTSLDMDVVLQCWAFTVDHCGDPCSGDERDNDTDHDLHHFFRRYFRLCGRLKSLRLRIEDGGWIPEQCEDITSGAPMEWLKLVNKFSNLTSLALHCHADKLNLENVKGSPRGSIEYWFSVLSLRHLKFLSLARWVFCSIDVKSMHSNLPSLRELHVENVALVAYLGNTFADIAVSLRNYYKGNCAIIFSDGPFLEVRL
jgi:hypothetical protein